MTDFGGSQQQQQSDQITLEWWLAGGVLGDSLVFVFACKRTVRCISRHIAQCHSSGRQHGRTHTLTGSYRVRHDPSKNRPHWGLESLVREGERLSHAHWLLSACCLSGLLHGVLLVSYCLQLLHLPLLRSVPTLESKSWCLVARGHPGVRLLAFSCLMCISSIIAKQWLQVVVEG